MEVETVALSGFSLHFNASLLVASKSVRLRMSPVPNSTLIERVVCEGAAEEGEGVRQALAGPWLA